MTAKLFKLSVLLFLITNIITNIHHLITRMGMSYSEYIYSMNLSKIIIKIDMIYLCSFHTVYHHLLLYYLTAFFNAKMKLEIIELGTLYFHLHLYFVDAFFNARMVLKIYHLIILIIIMIDLSFSVIYLLCICYFFYLCISYSFSFTYCSILLCKY